MHYIFKLSAAGAALLTSLHLVQAMPTASQTISFTGGMPSSFYNERNTQLSADPVNGLVLPIEKIGDSPLISSRDTYFYGIYTLEMQSIGVGGVVGAFSLQSKDLDEIDFEFLGGPKGLNAVQTNWFGRGHNPNGANEKIISGVSPHTGFHSYTIDWTAERIILTVDGQTATAVTVTAAQAGDRFPKTPMYIKLGAWIGCQSQECLANDVNCGDDPNVRQGTCVWVGSVFPTGVSGKIFFGSVVLILSLGN